jgi:sugar O-acyltransferase (sialic acid O-acetyltransferase NeuD family)
MIDVAIYGASGFGRLLLDTIRQHLPMRPVAFLDFECRRHGEAVDGVPVLGGMEMVAPLLRKGVCRMAVAIGDNRARQRVADALRRAGARLVSVIHPQASIAASARVGEHVFIGPRAIVCVHARVARDSVVSAGVIVEHDCRVGRGAFLYPAVRLAGAVQVGDGAALGIGSCVIPGRRVGRMAVVEAGSVVTRDVADQQHVGGAPAGALEPGGRVRAARAAALPIDGVERGERVAHLVQRR